MKPSVRASSLDRLLSCPGSATLCARVTHRESGAPAVEGTALHWLAHEQIKRTLGAVGDIGPTPPMPKSITVSKWIADFYVRFVRDTIPADWSIECEASLEAEYARFILTGHPDDIGMSPDCTEAIITDLKCGYDPVEPAENSWQLLAYAALLRAAYPTLRKVTAYIIQPRNDEDEGFQRVSDPMVIEGDAMDAAIAGLEARINAALDSPMDLETGISQCKYCEAILQCPAAIKLRELMKHTMTEGELEQVRATPDDAKLVEWVVAKTTLTNPFKTATEMAQSRFDEVGALTGTGIELSVKTEGGAYTVEDKDAFLAAFREKLPSEASLAKCWKPSMTSVKDEIAEVLNVPKSGKAPVTAATIFDGTFRPLVTQGVRRKFVFRAIA